MKPTKEGICDVCGNQIYQRIDDTPKVIQERLGVYETQTQPLLEFYREKLPFVEFKCERTDIPPEVAVRKILKKLRKLKLNKMYRFIALRKSETAGLECIVFHGATLGIGDVLVVESAVENIVSFSSFLNG